MRIIIGLIIKDFGLLVLASVFMYSISVYEEQQKYNRVSNEMIQVYKKTGAWG